MLTGKAIISKALKKRSAGEIADLLGVHVAHVYNADGERGVSPTLHEALVDAGWIEARDRCRISADVTPAQRDALHELAAPFGGWSAFCRRLAESSEAECLLHRIM